MEKTREISLKDITHLIIVCNKCKAETKIPIDTDRTILNECGICRETIADSFFTQLNAIKALEDPSIYEGTNGAKLRVQIKWQE